MCFVCKLSFGLGKTLVAHAIGEHGAQLDDEEKRILAKANTSVILQLEPVASPVTAGQQHSHSSNSSPADNVKTEGNQDESFESKEQPFRSTGQSPAVLPVAATAGFGNRFLSP